MNRTIFLKQVKDPCNVKRLLQPASNNAKLGNGQKAISKGKWKGMRMFQLSLEERKTCPSTCNQWTTCYGNNMPFANRVNHLSSSFLSSLKSEVESLSSKYPEGFVIRLHVLGDFYSVPYVRAWENLLKKHQNLHIYGYTHRAKNSPIGSAIERLNSLGAWIRWSDTGGDYSANIQPEKGDIICPEQTGKTASCMTCGLCWSVKTPIRFLMH